jgi:hypothetical protein
MQSSTTSRRILREANVAQRSVHPEYRGNQAAGMNELYHRLKDAYVDANLNRITAALVELYKARQHEKLRDLARKVSPYVSVDDSRISKCFSQLVMLYHPDRGEGHRREIESAHAAGDAAGLRRFSHILLMGDFGHIPPPAVVAESVDFGVEYVWDIAEEDPGHAREFEEETFEDEQFEVSGEEYEHTFFQAIKMKFYGTLDIELPYYYLEDFEEIVMEGCGIRSLDGVGYCIHARVIDISSNALTDISDLWQLTRVTELYAAGNSIGYVDALSSLVNLRVVDLSLNDIDDISPLFELEHLEFVNVFGNPVPVNQIEKLRASGCTVLS